MTPLHFLPVAALAVLLVAVEVKADGRRQPLPLLMPNRDVDITYRITRAHQPVITQRVRWSAGEHLERIDGPDKSTSIFNRRGREITLLNGTNHTYRKLEGRPRQPMEPEKGAVLSRDGDSVVAGLHCINWSWIEDIETRTLCVTPDGVLLRLVVDGKTVIEARSVHYVQQQADLFEVPRDYTPALAPEGGPQP